MSQQGWLGETEFAMWNLLEYSKGRGVSYTAHRRKEAPAHMLSSAQTCPDVSRRAQTCISYVESSFRPCFDKTRLPSPDLGAWFLHLQLCLDGMED